MLTIRHNRFQTFDKSLRDVDVQEFINQPLVKPRLKILDGSIGSVLKDVADAHGITPDDIMGKQRTKLIAKARADFVCTLHFKYKYAPARLAHMMNMDLTSIKHIIGLRKNSKEDYSTLRARYE